MSDINTSKVDGNTVSASEFNQLAEIDNLISTSGQTPSTGNLEQQAIASARYSSAGNFFTDSGTANAYVLSPVSPFKSPVSSTAGEGYYNGMVIRFLTPNACSGASTVNVNNAGSKSLVKSDGSTALTTGDIPANTEVEFVYNGTNFVQSLGKVPGTSTTQGVVFRKAPTIQKITSGSGTYTTSAGALYLKLRMTAGGGGGGGSGLTGGTGGNGGNSTFGTSLLTTTGGVGGVFNAQGSSGGTATVSSPAISILDVAGSNGGTAEQARTFAYGGSGGSNPISAVAPMSNATAGLSGKLGGGGAGGSGGATAIITGSGGGAGAYIEAIIPNPSATYSYAVGSGGAGGTAGTSGFAGGAGGNGFIEITEFYN